MLLDRWLTALAVLVVVAVAFAAFGQAALSDLAPGAWKGEIPGRATVSLNWGDGSLSGAVSLAGNRGAPGDFDHDADIDILIHFNGPAW